MSLMQIVWLKQFSRVAVAGSVCLIGVVVAISIINVIRVVEVSLGSSCNLQRR